MVSCSLPVSTQSSESRKSHRLQNAPWRLNRLENHLERRQGVEVSQSLKDRGHGGHRGAMGGDWLRTIRSGFISDDELTN